MSKSGNKKDKKGDTSSALLQQYQAQKRQLLDCQFSMKKMQQRMNDLTQDNILLRRQINQSREVHNESVQELTIKNMANQKRLLGLSNEKTKLEIDNQQKDNKIRILQKNLMDQQLMRQKDIQQMRKNQHFQIAKFQSQLSEYKLYMGQRDQLEQQRQELIQKCQIQKANNLREVADKQRQKVQATDKLKDEMLYKINDMRKNLFSLKREQLTTTTRLTMLQNHQLTSQLEYQSKQTEKLIFRNQQLQQKVNSLKQELDIHKQVEDELAKRSHFSKGIIKKLNLKINQLQGQVETLKSASCLAKNGQNIDDDQSNKRHKTQQSSAQNIKINENKNKIISTLEQQLQKSQKNYVQLLNVCEGAKRQVQTLNDKLYAVDEKANSIYKIMQRYYDEVVMKGQLTLLQNQQGSNFLKQNTLYQLNLQVLRQTSIQQWKLEDLTLATQILLNIIKPYMIRQNLMIPAVRKNIILSDGIMSVKKFQTSKSLPKLATQRKDVKHQSRFQQMPTNIASKIVASNLREWGQTIKLSKSGLNRKYKLAQSFRG